MNLNLKSAIIDRVFLTTSASRGDFYYNEESNQKPFWGHHISYFIDNDSSDICLILIENHLRIQNEDPKKDTNSEKPAIITNRNIVVIDKQKFGEQAGEKHEEEELAFECADYLYDEFRTLVLQTTTQMDIPPLRLPYSLDRKTPLIKNDN